MLDDIQISRYLLDDPGWLETMIVSLVTLDLMPEADRLKVAQKTQWRLERFLRLSYKPRPASPPARVDPQLVLEVVKLARRLAEHRTLDQFNALVIDIRAFQRKHPGLLSRPRARQRSSELPPTK